MWRLVLYRVGDGKNIIEYLVMYLIDVCLALTRIACYYQAVYDDFLAGIGLLLFVWATPISKALGEFLESCQQCYFLSIFYELSFAKTHNLYICSSSGNNI